jgi:murein DD-endopeptidase MepM/ murein hydrolase activator NlpD
MVQAGDTLFAISTHYQIPLRALIDVNRLSAPFALAEGQVLSLPAPRFHRVQQGETLLAVARLYNIDARSLALLNRMASPYVVRPGDQLVLPALARASAAPPPRPAPPPGAVAASPKAAPPAGAIKFVWPFKGRVLAGFGPQVGGKRLDGVDIATPAGAPVQAAADGRVVYAGADLPGYGKLILVQHEGEWVTAYAHLGAFEAAEGARVKKGETIALAGPLKLHFQVRRRGEPTDPAPYLPPV